MSVNNELTVSREKQNINNHSKCIYKHIVCRLLWWLLQGGGVLLLDSNVRLGRVPLVVLELAEFRWGVGLVASQETVTAECSCSAVTEKPGGRERRGEGEESINRAHLNKLYVSQVNFHSSFSFLSLLLSLPPPKPTYLISLLLSLPPSISSFLHPFSLHLWFSHPPPPLVPKADQAASELGLLLPFLHGLSQLRKHRYHLGAVKFYLIPGLS